MVLGETGRRVRTVLLAGDDMVEAALEPPVRLIDPPPPLEGLADYRSAVRRALLFPRGTSPLPRLVGKGARVVVAFDDPCLPLPPPVFDPRRAAVGEVLRILEDAGVRDEDISLVCANGLHRMWSRAELLPLLGPRILRRYAGRLRCYDAEDPQGSVRLSGPDDIVVELDREAAQADLVVYVGVPWTEMNGGHKSLACGLATYASIRQHHDPGVQAESPLMEPERSAMHGQISHIGRIIGRQVPVFQVETVMNNRVWAGPFRLLDTRRSRPALTLRAARALGPGPRRSLRKVLMGWYRPAGVWAGAVELVHQASLARLAQMRGGPEPPADILVLPVPDQSPYSVHSWMNPLLVANLGLGYAFQFGRPQPLVRPGGWVILVSPCRLEFHPRHHLAYRRFWDEVLPHTRDAHLMRRDWEPAFVSDPALVHAYRFERAYHPAHPFFSWYWLARALNHVGGVIVAGAADRETSRRLGFWAAPDVETAVRLAREQLGFRAEVAVQRLPPAFIVEVEPDGGPVYTGRRQGVPL